MEAKGRTVYGLFLWANCTVILHAKIVLWDVTSCGLADEY
jgi:hypothetical protein